MVYTLLIEFLLEQFIITWSKYGDWNLQCIVQCMQHVLHLASIWKLRNTSCKLSRLKRFPRIVWLSGTNLFNLWSLLPWQHQNQQPIFYICIFLLYMYLKYSPIPVPPKIKRPNRVNKNRRCWQVEGSTTKLCFWQQTWWKWIAVTNIESTTCLSR